MPPCFKLIVALFLVRQFYMAIALSVLRLMRVRHISE